MPGKKEWDLIELKKKVANLENRVAALEGAKNAPAAEAPAKDAKGPKPKTIKKDKSKK